MNRRYFVLATLCYLLFSRVTCPAAAGELVVHTDFEGGSARVLEIDQEDRHISIMPGGDTARGWPAWWCFQVTGLTKDEVLKVSVIASNQVLPPDRPGAGKPLGASWAMPERAAWSADGKSWQQTSQGKRDNAVASYELTSPGSELWIAWGPLATPAVMNAWMDRMAEQHSFISVFELAKTREGRSVRGIRVASDADADGVRPIVWFQARQHAWESGSSCVARGIGRWLASDAVDAVWLRQNAITFIVPIMDVDRAATGDGGKESVPHDHNRDWSDSPHYPEVAATQQRILEWSKDNRLAVFADLHNPGPSDKQAFFYVAADEAMEASQRPLRDRFLDLVQRRYDGAIELTRKTHSTGPNYHPLWNQISSNWVSLHGNPKAISVCLETPWNTANSTADGYESVGAGLAKGVVGFLQSESERTTSAD